VFQGKSSYGKNTASFGVNSLFTKLPFKLTVILFSTPFFRNSEFRNSEFYGLIQQKEPEEVATMGRVNTHISVKDSFH